MSKRVWEQVEEALEMLLFGKKSPSDDEPQAEVAPVCLAPLPITPGDPSAQ